MRNMVDDIDFQDGVIELNDFYYEPEMYPEEQKWFFKNDILQVQYDDGKYILDVGWLPEFNLIEGAFKIVAIYNYDWDKPVFRRNAVEINKAKLFLKEAIELIGKLRFTRDG